MDLNISLYYLYKPYYSFMTNTCFKLEVLDRNYTQWNIYETETYQKIDTVFIHPFEHKMFSNDVFQMDANQIPVVVHSSIRNTQTIPGVLILDGNKTYGREKKTNGKQGRLLYKCVPDDIRLPPFIVPYEIKHVGFSKVFKNMYVTFQFEHWNEKHPHGKLNNVIGDVDILDNFYEYQLYCKSLHSSIQKFQKEATNAVKQHCQDNIIQTIQMVHPSIVDRTDQQQWNIITIDSNHCQDFDDAISIRQLDNNVLQLSIYISNVTVWMDLLQLWDTFSKRISTIYLPDKKRPMLPTILSDGLCSLQQNVKRAAFVMDIFIQNGKIIDTQYVNAFIQVSHNYVYETDELFNQPDYKRVFECVQHLATHYKYMKHVRNSHEVICYLMTLMNYKCAQELAQHKTGIFRTAVVHQTIAVPDNIPDHVSKFIQMWNSTTGQYIHYNDIQHHGSIQSFNDVDAYIHITSPIRRLVDLLNMIQFQTTRNMLVLSKQANDFYTKWLNELEYINKTMRSIRKIQCDCSLLHICVNDPKTIEKEYDGYVFDKMARNDLLYQYTVYLPELKLTTRLTLRENINNYSLKQFRLFVFHNEERFKRKIRLQLL